MVGAAAMTLKARPTTYKGIQMRSRLEALYAEWLDSQPGFEWHYEPECFADETGQYLPDFLVSSAVASWYVEVKPTKELALAALPDMHRILSSEPDARMFATWPAGDYPNLYFTNWKACLPDGGCGACERRKAIVDIPFAYVWEASTRQVSNGASLHCPNCGAADLRLTDVVKRTDRASGVSTLHAELRARCVRCDDRLLLTFDNYFDSLSMSLTRDDQ